MIHSYFCGDDIILIIQNNLNLKFYLVVLYQNFQAFLANPEAFIVAAAPAAAVKEDKPAAKEPEPESESDDDMGFDMFG